ncbi:hypothetical protein JMJ77_0013386, partial [Colletotrichum scovillei]
MTWCSFKVRETMDPFMPLRLSPVEE